MAPVSQFHSKCTLGGFRTRRIRIWGLFRESSTFEFVFLLGRCLFSAFLCCLLFHKNEPQSRIFLIYWKANMIVNIGGRYVAVAVLQFQTSHLSKKWLSNLIMFLPFLTSLALKFPRLISYGTFDFWAKSLNFSRIRRFAIFFN